VRPSLRKAALAQNPRRRRERPRRREHARRSGVGRGTQRLRPAANAERCEHRIHLPDQPRRRRVDAERRVEQKVPAACDEVLLHHRVAAERDAARAQRNRALLRRALEPRRLRERDENVPAIDRALRLRRRVVVAQREGEVRDVDERRAGIRELAARDSPMPAARQLNRDPLLARVERRLRPVVAGARVARAARDGERDDGETETAAGDARNTADACRAVPAVLYSRRQPAPNPGGEMRTAFMSIEEGFVTYLEGVTLASQNAEPRNPGACRRR
jgi:hypothetical protein